MLPFCVKLLEGVPGVGAAKQARFLVKGLDQLTGDPGGDIEGESGGESEAGE